MLERYLKMILNSRVYDVACETPLVYAERLSQRLDNDIRMKREDLQPVHSFKCRGAYNKISALSETQSLTTKFSETRLLYFPNWSGGRSLVRAP